VLDLSLTILRSNDRSEFANRLMFTLVVDVDVAVGPIVCIRQAGGSITVRLNPDGCA